MSDTRLWGGSPAMTTVEVLPGLDLDLMPWEVPADIADELATLFAEIDAQPGLGWPPDDAASDPNYVAWMAEGGVSCGATWGGDFSGVLAAEDRDDWIGM